MTPGLRFVLFDLYETMVVFDHASVRAARERVLAPVDVSVEALERAERSMLGDRMLGRCGASLLEEMAAVLRAAGAPTDPRFVARFTDAEVDTWHAATHVHDDVMPCLHALLEGGLELGLISNCVGLTRELLPDWPFSHLFRVIVLSCEVRLTKPDGAIFDHAVDESGYARRQGGLVDDLAANVAAARRAGLRGWHLARRDAPTPAESDDVIRDLGELTELLVRRPVANAATR